MCSLCVGCVHASLSVLFMCRMCPCKSKCVLCVQDVSMQVLVCSLSAGCVHASISVFSVSRMCPCKSKCVLCLQDVSVQV